MIVVVAVVGTQMKIVVRCWQTVAGQYWFLRETKKNIIHNTSLTKYNHVIYKQYTLPMDGICVN